MNTKNKIKLNYKQLRLSDNYLYASEEEQVKQAEKQKEKQEKQDKKTINTDKYIDWMINKEDADVNQEIFQKYFKIQKLSFMYKVLRTINDKKRNSNVFKI